MTSSTGGCKLNSRNYLDTTTEEDAETEWFFELLAEQRY